MPTPPPGSAEGATSPPQQSPGEASRGRERTAGDRTGQEQGCLYPARPRPMSLTGAASRKDKLAAAVVLGRGRDVPRDIPRSCRAQGWRRWAQEHPHRSWLQGFPWTCFQKLNSFTAPPFPASSHCLRSLLAAHPAQSCPFSSLQGSHGAGCPEALPLSPLANPWHSRTPGGPREAGLAPWHLPAAPGLWICPAGTAALSRAMSSSRPLEVARRMEGGSRYIPIPRNAQQEEQDNTEIVQTSAFQKNICRFWQLEHFTGEPRRGWDTSQQYPSPGKGNIRPDPALPTVVTSSPFSGTRR